MYFCGNTSLGKMTASSAPPATATIFPVAPLPVPTSIFGAPVTSTAWRSLPEESTHVLRVASSDW